MGNLSKNTFDQYAKSFKEATHLDSKQHPEAFMAFCNHLLLLQINSKLEAALKDLKIDDPSKKRAE